MLKRKTLRQQQLDAELGLIIDEMGQAMWNADKMYIARVRGMTIKMLKAFDKFIGFCRRNYGQKG